LKERELIEAITRLTGSDGAGVLRAIGDDCAVVEKSPGQVWLLTMDTLVESVHFDLRWHTPELLARKSVSVNVSDIAAMGGKPLFALLSLGLPSGFDPQWFERFSASLVQSCKAYGCLLIGGDTVRSPDRLLITITLVGQSEQDLVLYRSGARPGDTVWVSGPLGLAACGLELCRAGLHLRSDTHLQSLIDAHLDPQARTKLGRQLAASGLVHAMMDLSDGLATDLAHLCKESGVGAIIEADMLPKSSELTQGAALLGLDPLALMLSGGEDYELLFTSAPEYDAELLQLTNGAGHVIYPIGMIEEASGVKIRRREVGTASFCLEDISYQGYDHFA
jgi:thiamine-monophosphate kinase